MKIRLHNGIGKLLLIRQPVLGGFVRLLSEGIIFSFSLSNKLKKDSLVS
jgi:hypothetical protein